MGGSDEETTNTSPSEKVNPSSDEQVFWPMGTQGRESNLSTWKKNMAFVSVHGVDWLARAKTRGGKVGASLIGDAELSCHRPMIMTGARRALKSDLDWMAGHLTKLHPVVGRSLSWPCGEQTIDRRMELIRSLHARIW